MSAYVNRGVLGYGPDHSLESINGIMAGGPAVGIEICLLWCGLKWLEVLNLSVGLSYFGQLVPSCYMHVRR
jgi:hypothetical protein